MSYFLTSGLSRSAACTAFFCSSEATPPRQLELGEFLVHRLTCSWSRSPKYFSVRLDWLWINRPSATSSSDTVMVTTSEIVMDLLRDRLAPSSLKVALMPKPQFW